jgi:Galactose-3-O-sulfotransferase
VADRCLIFVHVPKTAGRTLNRVLRRQYRRSETIDFTTLDKPLEEFRNVPIEERARARLVLGHVHYGVHRWIPGDATYITILRDPVHRVLSLYGYILRQPRHPLHDQLITAGIGLEEFVQTGLDRSQVDNGQTRQIAGVQETDVIRGHLGRAIENLQDFAVVGLAERFDETLILMKRELGWRTPFYVSQNVSPRPATGSHAISDQALGLIREKNGLDLELYSEASRMFEDLVAGQDRSFGQEVARFKRLNRVSEAVGGKLSPILDRVKYSALVKRVRRVSR